MSFEIYVSAFEDEEHREIATAALRERFAPHIAREDQELGYWELGFDERPCFTQVFPDGGGARTTGFTAFHPTDEIAFWEIIAGILRDFPCVLFWRGGGAVIGSLDLLRHLPADFVETMGVPWVSTDAETIRRYVWDHS